MHKQKDVKKALYVTWFKDIQSSHVSNKTETFSMQS